MPFDVYVSVCPCVIMCRETLQFLSCLLSSFSSLLSLSKKIGRKELLTGNNQICERKQIKHANRQTSTKLTNHFKCHQSENVHQIDNQRETYRDGLFSPVVALKVIQVMFWLCRCCYSKCMSIIIVTLFGSFLKKL